MQAKITYRQNGKIVFRDVIQEIGNGVVNSKEELGRQAWLWLHTEARAGRLTLELLATKFRAMIPRYGCACLKDWDEILLLLPFRFDDQFAWSVEIHNAVNAKIGNPLLSLEAAAMLYPERPAQDATTPAPPAP